MSRAGDGVVRVELPYHLRLLASVGREVELRVAGEVTLGGVLDALEEEYPALRGTVRDHVTRARRPFLRFYACGRDLSLEPPETPLPDAVTRGGELFRIVGGLAGG